MPGDLDATYVLARRVLLDMLEALAAHRDAVILVGAQAIYLHTGDGDLAVAPYTTDGDLALDPGALGPSPLLEEALGRAGFQRSAVSGVVGTWIGRDNVPIDLMVPEAVGGEGRRGARLGPHGNRAARKARGLEAVLVDHAPMMVAALDSADGRQIEVKVAGPTALLVAKLHKIADRRHVPGRHDDKDALDVYRLLVTVSTAHVAARARVLLHEPLSSEVTSEALRHLAAMFGDIDAEGARMAARSVELLGNPEEVAASCAALTQDLLDAIRRAGR